MVLAFEGTDNSSGLLMIPWLEIVTGLLGLLSGALSVAMGWILVQIVGLRVKVAENKAQSDAEDKAHKEAREVLARETDRRFAERQLDRERESTIVFSELKKIEGSVTKVHERLDAFIGQNQNCKFGDRKTP